MIDCILGIITGIGLGLMLGNQVPSNFKVGDCVRLLGEEAFETVTVVSPYGGIETKTKNAYPSGPDILTAYNKLEQQNLVACSK